jgi:hypothetical protein
MDGAQPIAKPLPTQDRATEKNVDMHTSVGFRHTIPVFEQFKTIHALDHMTIGTNVHQCYRC